MTLQGMTLDGVARMPGSPFGDLELFVRSWPADEHELTLEYAADDGAVITGRWCEGLLTLHPQGEDRRLPGLEPLLAEPGARLLRHRAGRRAVVRSGDAYATVVRPARAPAVIRSAARAAELTDGSPFDVAARRVVGRRHRAWCASPRCPARLCAT